MKKRKRKGTSSETVEGFNVFRSSTSVAQSNDEVRVIEESVELYNNKKKEQNKKLKDTIFRKQHNIHVSGYNVSSLLQHNISEKSPGPGNNNLTVLNNFNDIVAAYARVLLHARIGVSSLKLRVGFS
ncbi:hypothetical protein HKD37_13G035734 [Glycine soja]